MKEMFIEELIENFGEPELNEYIETNDILCYNDDFQKSEIKVYSVKDLVKLKMEWLKELKQEYLEYLEEIEPDNEDNDGWDDIIGSLQ